MVVVWAQSLFNFIGARLSTLMFSYFYRSDMLLHQLSGSTLFIPLYTVAEEITYLFLFYPYMLSLSFPARESAATGLYITETSSPLTPEKAVGMGDRLNKNMLGEQNSHTYKYCMDPVYADWV